MLAYALDSGTATWKYCPSVDHDVSQLSEYATKASEIVFPAPDKIIVASVSGLYPAIQSCSNCDLGILIV